MNDVLYLAWAYVKSHRAKTTILVLSLALIFFLPAGLQVLVKQSEASLTARAEPHLRSRARLCSTALRL